MNLPILSTAAQTMSSREIADLVEARHNDVIATIQRLFEKGLLRSSRKSRQEATGGRPIMVYDLIERDTHLVVAGYSDEHRARIIDHWDQLRHSVLAIPQTLPEALRLAADLAERVDQQQARLTVAEPKAAGFDRLANSTGLYSLRDAAKTLGWPERQLAQWLVDHGWAYRGQDGRLQPYAHRCQSGYMTSKLGRPVQTSTGERVFSQTMLTAAGLARLSAIRAKKSSNDDGEGAA